MHRRGSPSASAPFDPAHVVSIGSCLGRLTTQRLRRAPLVAAARRVAHGSLRSPFRDRPFRTGFRSAGAGPAGHLVSTPAGKPVGCAPRGLSRSSAWCRCARRATLRLAVLTTVALDTVPQFGPDTSRLTPLVARSGRVERAVLVVAASSRHSRSRPRVASEGASESAEMVALVDVESHGRRVVVSKEDAE